MTQHFLRLLDTFLVIVVTDDCGSRKSLVQLVSPIWRDVIADLISAVLVFADSMSIKAIATTSLDFTEVPVLIYCSTY